MFQSLHFPLWRWPEMTDEIIEVKQNAKFPISSALLIFMIAQTVAAVWWGATITANLINLNGNIVNGDMRTQKRIDELEKRIDDKESKINDQAKQIQSLREQFLVQFGKQSITQR
jgi:hypothetical protein